MRNGRLVAPALSLLMVLVLLTGAKTIEAWPVKPPPCLLRTFTGVPCLGCGGTRTMKALARGDIVGAVQINPLVVVAVFGVVLWFIWTVATMKMARYQPDWAGETNGRPARNFGKRWGIAIAVLALLNWIYLICYLPL